MQIKVEILRYVVQHPEAKDTVEGIAQWWLLGARANPSVAEVKAGLDCLVAQGRLAAERQADGRIYYCRPKAARPADRVRSNTKQDETRQA